MDLRYFLKGLGTGAVGLRLPPTASSATSCKIVGIGSAGCNFVLAASRSDTVLESAEMMPEFICINFGLDILREVDVANRTELGRSPVKALSLSALVSAAGRVNRGRAAALRNRDALRAILAGTDVVFLVAGLGGGTGSGVTPIMARLAHEAGALTVAAVVTPFELEREARNRTADNAISYLKREADLVLRFSNQELMEVTADDITQDDFFARQNQRIAVCLRGLMDGESDATRT